jgi:hypothetical protein
MAFPTSSLKLRLAAAQRFVEGRPADEALYRFWLCARVARDLIASGEVAEAQKYAKPMQRLLDEGLPTCGLPTAAIERIAFRVRELIAVLGVAAPNTLEALEARQ